MKPVILKLDTTYIQVATGEFREIRTITVQDGIAVKQVPASFERITVLMRYAKRTGQYLVTREGMLACCFVKPENAEPVISGSLIHLSIQSNSYE